MNIRILRNRLDNIHFWKLGNDELRIIWALSNQLKF